MPPAFLLAVSPKDELLLLLTSERAPYISPGRIASVPAMGGIPRELVEKATYADWSSDGKRMVVAGETGCEFPLGRRFSRCGVPRMSPSGEHIVWLKGTGLVIQAADGAEVKLTDIPHVYGLAWSSDGREVWFTGAESGSPHERALYAVTRDGRRRLVARAPASLNLYDVASDGRSALVVTGAGWHGINAAINGEVKERALDHLGRTDIVGLSADGTWLLMNENREVGPGTYLRSTDGRKTIPLSSDIGRGLSPDARWALVQTRNPNNPQLKLVPAGAGAARDLPLSAGLALVEFVAKWSSEGHRLFVPLRSTSDGALRVHMWENDGPWKAVTPPGVMPPFVVSPNGQTVAMADSQGVVTLYPVDGGSPTPLAGELGRPMHWSADGRELLLAGPELLPMRIYRRDLATGRIQPWRSLAPADLSGAMQVMRVLIAADGRSYVYQYSRALNELFLAYDLR
jgi:dipeptidyl aminopeptidase/acylaminoacyl peptidase